MLFDGLPNEPMPGQVPAAPAPQQPQQPSGSPAGAGQQLRPEQQLSQQRQKQLMQEVSRMRQAQEQQMQPKREPERRSMLRSLFGARKTEEVTNDYETAKSTWLSAHKNVRDIELEMAETQRKMDKLAKSGSRWTDKTNARDLRWLEHHHRELTREMDRHKTSETYQRTGH